MKCQNCGKNEINFHYTSNVNGCVTEAHLCSECAAKSGYDFRSMFSTGSIFDGFFPVRVDRAFLPIPMFGFSRTSPFTQWARISVPSTECSCSCGCETTDKGKPATEVDNDMLRRREINAIREQMRIAAEKEDFEKAAQLRDQIRQLEAE